MMRGALGETDDYGDLTGKVAPEKKGPRLFSSRHRRANWIKRGHDKTHQHHKREPGFFAIKIQERFEFSPGWHRKGEVRGLVLAYHYVLRSVLRANPHLRRCRTRCRHCGILFITDPRNVKRSNAKRNDLGCPFGCREAHRKRCSTERSVAYYRSDEGKSKKKMLNDKRSRTKLRQAVDRRTEEDGKVQEKGRTVGISDFNEGMVSYLRMVTSLIEGRRISRDEIVEMLARVLRQHSIAYRRRADYFVWYLNKYPP